MPKHLPPLKEKEERVKEGITILKKLRDLGVPESLGEYNQLKDIIRTWVNEGEYWKGKLVFPTFERVADITLPSRQGYTAELYFRKL
jgi:hypothetical protein